MLSLLPVFTAQTTAWEFQTPEARESLSKGGHPFGQGRSGQRYLGKLDVHKSMGLDGMHP